MKIAREISSSQTYKVREADADHWSAIPVKYVPTRGKWVAWTGHRESPIVVRKDAFSEPEIVD